MWSLSEWTHQMNAGRFSLRLLMLLVAVVSAFFPLANLFDAWMTISYDESQ